MEINTNEYRYMKTQSVDGDIYCIGNYQYKDRIRQLGYKYNPGLRLFYISENKFTEELYNKTCKIPKMIFYTKDKVKIRIGQVEDGSISKYKRKAFTKMENDYVKTGKPIYKSIRSDYEEYAFDD